MNQADGLATLFPTPNHPSYPAAHGSNSATAWQQCCPMCSPMKRTPRGPKRTTTPGRASGPASITGATSTPVTHSATVGDVVLAHARNDRS
jgi:hypothetical protein